MKFLAPIGIFIAMLLSVFGITQNDTLGGATVVYPGQGGTGTSTSPTAGQMLMGTASGTYTLIASSTLGGLATEADPIWIAASTSYAGLALNNIFTGLNTFSATTSLVTTTISGSLTLSNGQILAPTGTVSLPTYSFGTDPNTGIYSSAADTLNFTTNGTSRLQIGSTGLVGIGNTSPSSTFHVTGTSTFQSSEANAISVKTANGSDKYFSVDGSEVNSGNIHIGSTGSGIDQSVIRFRTNVRDGYIAMYNSTGQMDFFPGGSGGLIFNFKELLKMYDYGKTALFKNNASTALTAGTEYIGLDFDMSSQKTWNTGSLALQRETLFRTSTYAFNAASILTEAATVAIAGAPVAGANATISYPYAFWIQGGAAKFGGRMLGKQGNDIVSVNDLTLGDGNVFEITSSTQINDIATSTWQNGSEITLMFATTTLLKYNGSDGAGTVAAGFAPMIFSGLIDYSSDSGSILKLILSEIGGVQAWREFSRFDL